MTGSSEWHDVSTKIENLIVQRQQRAIIVQLNSPQSGACCGRYVYRCSRCGGIACASRSRDWDPARSNCRKDSPENRNTQIKFFSFSSLSLCANWINIFFLRPSVRCCCLQSAVMQSSLFFFFFFWNSMKAHQKLCDDTLPFFECTNRLDLFERWCEGVGRCCETYFRIEGN